MKDLGIDRPIFISIGDTEKLNTFLSANEWMPRDQMLVDDYNFDAYRAAGFGRFDQLDKESVKDVKMAAPDLGWKAWFTYFSNVSKISPIPKDIRFGEIPEGVLWVGGTFVLDGNDVLYQWNDQVPGNHPNIKDVLNTAINAVINRKEKKLFPW